MAKYWHKVVVDGVARYRASASRRYVSYNVASGSWSSKMLAGNIPCEQMAAAPKTIKVRGEAWGVKVERSYLEGETPVVAVLAYRGRAACFNWDKFKAAGNEGSAMYEDQQNPAYRDAADPDYVFFDHYTHRTLQRAQESAQYMLARIAKGEAGSINAVMVVELR